MLTVTVTTMYTIGTLGEFSNMSYSVLGLRRVNVGDKPMLIFARKRQFCHDNLSSFLPMLRILRRFCLAVDPSLKLVIGIKALKISPSGNKTSSVHEQCVHYEGRELAFEGKRE